MMIRSRRWILTAPALMLALTLTLALSSCSDDTNPPADSGPQADGGGDGAGDAAPPAPDLGFGPGPKLAALCGGQPWSATLTPGTVGKLGGTYTGYLTGVTAAPYPKHSLEMVKVIPQHPFWAKTIRVAFATGTGKARLRLVSTLGRSVPGAYPAITKETHDLIKARTITVSKADPATWVEVDISGEHLLLSPTQHYMILYEHITPEPYLAQESLPDGETSRSTVLVPTSIQTYGVKGNFRMELAGDFFCAWKDAARWFQPAPGQPFDAVVTSKVGLADLDGDGHDDLILNSTRDLEGIKVPHPVTFLGDGKGAFSAAKGDPFASVRAGAVMIFGDLDNDGDRDAVALTNIPADADGDGALVTGPQADCDDSDAKVHPGATEISGNGKDDDCDGITDDGKSTSDGDGDGHSIAAGDCDDTRKEVYPGAKELLDRRDNDCDGAVDETFTNQVLLNDGKGAFSVKAASGIEVLDPSTVGALGDGDGDGKLDLYWGNWLVHYPDDAAVPDRYFRGAGDGSFSDAMQAAGLTLKTPYSPYGVRWLDYNNDGLQDLYVGNYHLYPNQLWKNTGSGGFVDVAPQLGVHQDGIAAPASMAQKGLTGGHSYGVAVGDVDNDGDMDLFITNLAHPRTQPWSDPSVFAVNKGPPTFAFEDRRAKAGFIYDEGDINALFADYDNDMDLDLLVVSLYPQHYSKLYRNDGAAGFADVTYQSGTAVHDATSAVWADVDEDGDLDLLLAGRAVDSKRARLFLNRASGKNAWVELVLQGTTSNRDAAGARVSLKAGSVTQLRDVEGGGGNSQSPPTVHFGLGQSAAIDALSVRWVGGKTESFSGAKPRGRYRIIEGNGKAVLIK